MALSEIILKKIEDSGGDNNVLNIIEFAESKAGLGLKLYPAQRFILKMFYGIQLDTEVDKNDPIIIRDQFNVETLHTFSESEFLDFLHKEGRINISYEEYLKRDKPYNEAIFAIGRRGSKTVMSSIITLYTLYLLLRIYNPHEYFRVLPSDAIGIAIASNSRKGADRQFASISSMINNSPFFKRFVLFVGGTSVTLGTRIGMDLRTQGKDISDHYRIYISAFSVSPSVRGASNVAVILDEFGHFVDSEVNGKHKPMDEMMYEALTPSVSGFTEPDGKSFGKKFIISSPNGPKGMLYRMLQEAHKFNENTLAINTPSHWVNLRVSSDEIRDLWNKSELSCRQEFGGEFISKESDWISVPNKVFAAVNTLNPNVLASSRVNSSLRYFLGIDLGLSWDGACFAIAHYEAERPTQGFINEDLENLVCKGEAYVVDYIHYMSPKDRDTGILDMDDVLKTIKMLCDRYKIVKGIYDQWSGEVWTQQFKKYGLSNILQQFNATQQSNNDLAMNFKQIIMDGKLMLPDYPQFTDEIFSLKETVGRNGLIKVENTTEHDDMFDAVSRALYLCFQNKNMNGNISINSSISGYRNVAGVGTSGLNRHYTRRGNAALNKRLNRFGLK